MRPARRPRCSNLNGIETKAGLGGPKYNEPTAHRCNNKLNTLGKYTGALQKSPMKAWFACRWLAAKKPLGRGGAPWTSSARSSIVSSI